MVCISICRLDDLDIVLRLTSLDVNHGYIKYVGNVDLLNCVMFGALIPRDQEPEAIFCKVEMMACTNKSAEYGIGGGDNWDHTC